MKASEQSILLKALKPNGKPHQSWQAKLLARKEQWIITHSAYGTSVRHHTKNLDYVMAHSNLGIFSTKEHYNDFIDFHKDGNYLI